MAIQCPHCAIDMREVAAAATTGYQLLLDQCPRCGGAAMRDPQSWPTVNNLDAAMHAPPDAAPDVRHELVTSGAWLALRAALRLLFNV